MRDATRDLASSQPEAAKKLRDALTEMDDTDLDNHVQRTADWLRRGINPNSNGTESEIARGLSKLSQQLQQTQNAVAQEKPGDRNGSGGAGQADQSKALDQVALREPGSNGARAGQTRRPTRTEPTWTVPTRTEWSGCWPRRSAVQQGTAKPQRAGRRRPATGEAEMDLAVLAGPQSNGSVVTRRRLAAGDRMALYGATSIPATIRRVHGASSRPRPVDASGNPPTPERSFGQRFGSFSNCGR